MYQASIYFIMYRPNIVLNFIHLFFENYYLVLNHILSSRVIVEHHK